MTALPPDDARTMRGVNPPQQVPVRALQSRWAALHDRADELAIMAQLAAEPRAKTTDSFDDLTSRASDWQRNLTMQALEDIEAMLEPGLAALSVIANRDQDPCAAALALWREFYSAREALLDMLKRSANRA